MPRSTFYLDMILSLKVIRETLIFRCCYMKDTKCILIWSKDWTLLSIKQEKEEEEEEEEGEEERKKQTTRQ